MGRVLKKRREDARLTMADVGRLLDRPYQMVQRYENGMIRLSYSRLTEIAAVLRASPAEIVAEATGEWPEYSPPTRRALFRLATRLSRVPEQYQNAALEEALARVEAFAATVPDSD